MTLPRSRSLLLALTLISGFGLGCGMGPEDEPTSPPPQVAAPPAVVEQAPPAPPALEQAPTVACKSEGAVTYDAVHKIVYVTLTDGGTYVTGVTPDANNEGRCVTATGQNVEMTCFSEGGACGDGIVVTGTVTGKRLTHTPTKLCATTVAATATAGEIPVSGLQHDLLALGQNLSRVKRTVSGLTGSDKEQTAALKALCEGSSDPACAPYVTARAAPLPAEATVEGSARHTPTAAERSAAARTERAAASRDDE